MFFSKYPVNGGRQTLFLLLHSHLWTANDAVRGNGGLFTCTLTTEFENSVDNYPDKERTACVCVFGDILPKDVFTTERERSGWP